MPQLNYDLQQYTQKTNSIAGTVNTLIDITKRSQEVTPFPAGDHKAAMNRRESMSNKRHKNTSDPQKKYRLGGGGQGGYGDRGCGIGSRGGGIGGRGGGERE